MNPTTNHKKLVWTCYAEWLERQLANGYLHTAYEVRTPTPRRFNSEKFAIGFAKRNRTRCWKVWFIKGIYGDASLFEEQVFA